MTNEVLYLNSMRTTQPSTKDRVLKMILKQSISINWNQCDQFFVERIKRHIHPPWAKKGGPNLATIVNYVSFEEVDSTRFLEMQIDSGLTWTDLLIWYVQGYVIFPCPLFPSLAHLIYQKCQQQNIYILTFHMELDCGDCCTNQFERVFRLQNRTVWG